QRVEELTNKRRLLLNCEWKATLMHPCSPPESTLLEMSRNGIVSNDPFLKILMIPACSTINRRPEPSPGCVTYTGWTRPETTRCHCTCGRVDEAVPQPAGMPPRFKKSQPAAAIATTTIRARRETTLKKT